ncbi:F-box protein SKIP22-like [Iris pallida]|uniref:F-box protein SKIP22-like n=1 Tax=Iris pallida TaxID=29817 RepID=A0AAX6H8F9_IRIPA|nr:F-box protein SKIP22-like [Iris pallida]
MEKVASLCPETVTPAETPNSETLIVNRWDMKVEMENEAAFPAPHSDEDTKMEVEEGSKQKSRVSVPSFLRRVMELEKDGIKGNLGFSLSSSMPYSWSGGSWSAMVSNHLACQNIGTWRPFPSRFGTPFLILWTL